MENKDELIDELIKGYQSPEEILGENGLLKQLTKAVIISISASVCRTYAAIP